MLLKLFIERVGSYENVYFIDAVNRGFDVKKISKTKKKPEYKKTILETRLGEAHFNLLDSFNCYGTNIGLSCVLCNQTFKRIGERKRKLPVEMVGRFEKSSKCTVENRKQCTVACKALRELQKSYNCLSGAEIILQPMGIKGEDSHEELALQYNILKMIFEPANDKHTYSDRELRFIDAHIKRFRLNDSQYRTRQLYEFVQSVIDSNGKLPTYEYNNLIVKLFREKLSDKSRKEIVKICESIFRIMFLKM